MRLFTAIDLPSGIIYRLERLLMVLRPEAFIKWSPLDNLHITTKFIGEWPELRLSELDEALASLGPRDSFEVEIRDLGWFPNERSPRVLWAGVHAGEALRELAYATQEAVAKLGVARETREYLSPSDTRENQESGPVEKSAGQGGRAAAGCAGQL